MKTKYIKPEIQGYEIKTDNLLFEVSNGTPVDDPGLIKSKRGQSFDSFDDEEDY